MPPVTTRETTSRQWPEDVLVAGLSRADASAQTAFVVLAHDAVFGHVCRLTRDRDLRQDWTHEILLRLMRDVSSGGFVYGRPGSFWAWFRTRAWFLALTERRRELRRSRREQLSPDGELPDMPADDDAALAAAEGEAAAALRDCMAKLDNPDHFQALHLRLAEDRTYDSIAAAMDRPINTIRTWIRRGRLELRRCLAARFGWSLPENAEPE